MAIVSMFRKANELSDDERRAVESLLGRKLEADETVSIRASKGVVVREAPTGKAREEAFLRFVGRADETSRKAESVLDTDVESAINDAVSRTSATSR